MGFEAFFTVEHHFLDEYSHCPAPEVLYGPIAQRTKKVRIGHGVRLLPFPYNHPVRAAEQEAVLDLLCDGRLDFGTGRSTSRLELEGFGILPNAALPYADLQCDPSAGNGFDQIDQPTHDAAF